MLKRLLKMLQPSLDPGKARPYSSQSKPIATAQRAAVPASSLQLVYPPMDQGIPVVAPTDLLHAQHEILARIKLHAAAQNARYDIRYLDPITRLSSEINALPGTLDAEFSGAGGLLRACLEMAFFCFQGSDGRIFTGQEGVEARHAKEPRWRYVCFAAGLLYPLGQTLERITVTTSKGQIWPKHSKDLTDWAKALGEARLYVTAVNSPTSPLAMGPAAFTSSLVAKIVGAENMQWLESASPELTAALYELATGAPSKAVIAQALIGQMWTKVRDREKARMPSHYGRLSSGSHLPPHLVASMRSALQGGTWEINERIAFADASGVFIQWPQAAGDIIRIASDQGAVVPNSEAVLAHTMCDAAVFEKNPLTDSGLFEITTKDGEMITAYRLRNPLSVLEMWDVAQYHAAHRLLGGVKKKSAAPNTEPNDQEKEFFERQGSIPFETSDLPMPQPLQEQADPEAEQKAPPSPVQAQPSQFGVERGDEPVDLDNQEAVDQPGGKSRKSKKKPPRLDAAQTAPGDQASLLEEPSSTVREDTKPAQEAGPGEPQQRTTRSGTGTGKPQAEQGGAQRTREAPDMEFAALLTEKLRQDLKSLQISEQVGKILSAYRKDSGAKQFKMTENGLVIDFAYLGKEISRNPVVLIDAMTGAGMIWTNPSTPGAKVMPYALVGNKETQCIVISKYGCRALGLGQGDKS